MKVDSQKSKVQGKLRKGVFFPAAGALVIFIGLVAAFPDKAYEVLTGLLYKLGYRASDLFRICRGLDPCLHQVRQHPDRWR